MSLLDKLRATSPSTPPEQRTRVSLTEMSAPPNVRPHDWQLSMRTPRHPTTGRERVAVGGSVELERILAIPRRQPVDPSVDMLKAEALIELMTSRLRRDNPACACAKIAPERLAGGGSACITRLNYAQAWALYEAPLAGGILGPIGVGHGKTGLDILISMVMLNAGEVAVLLIPPGLRGQLAKEYRLWAEHFLVPSMVIDGRGFVVTGRPVVHVVPFSRLSRPESTSFLDGLKPRLFVVDEGHKLKDRTTATTSRVLRSFMERPATMLVTWSGTLTSKSINDYAHLSALSLGMSSPLPLDPDVVEEWMPAIDPSDWPAPAGALLRLCDKGESLYSGFHRRLVETRGVIATTSSVIGATINLYERDPGEVPEVVREALHTLRSGDEEGGWTRPDGEELIDILQVAKCARELACGFYYRWRFPRREPDDLILEWLAKRKSWHKELRARLKRRSEHLDSPLLAAKAAIRAWADPTVDQHEDGDTWWRGGDVADEHGVITSTAPRLPLWKSIHWREWRDIREKVQPETEAVWLSDYLARDAATWARKHRGIVWYEHDAFGARVAELAGVNLHGGGPTAEARILAEKGDRSIVASIKAHGTGRDGLQRVYREQLIANPPSDGAAWEQLLGRLHREGQRADEVDAHVYRHTDELAEALDRAVIKAKYIEGTMGTMQKLLASTVHFDLDVET